MAELTVENVNISKIMSVEGAAEKVDQFVAALDENPAVKKLLDAAQSVEDVYHIAKDYIQMKLEDFKILFEKTVAYFKNEKAALPDEVMEDVVGGWSFSEWWNKWKRPIVASSILVGCVVGGALIGGALGGGPGAVVGAFTGLIVGAVASGTYMDATNPNKK